MTNTVQLLNYNVNFLSENSAVSNNCVHTSLKHTGNFRLLPDFATYFRVFSFRRKGRVFLYRHSARRHFDGKASRVRESLLSGDGKVSRVRESLFSGDGKVSRVRESLFSGDGKVSRVRESLLSGDGKVSRVRESLLSGDGKVSRVRESLLSGDGRVSRVRESLSDILGQFTTRKQELKNG